jgi:hypothetical protein
VMAQGIERPRRAPRALPVRGRAMLTTGGARQRLVAELRRDVALPTSLADAVLGGSQRVREHVHGRWRHLVVPAFTPTAGGRPSRREGEGLHVLVAPGCLVLLAPAAPGPAARLARSLAGPLGREWRREQVHLVMDSVPVGQALGVLLGLAVDAAFDSVESVSLAARRIEARALGRPSGRGSGAQALLAQRRRAETLRASLGVLRDGLGALRREPPRGVGGRFGRRLEDVQNHLDQALDALEAARDGLTAAINYHLAASQNRVNEVIKTLTVLATVITPITVISSIYGMNFAMPETEWRYGYVFALGLMATCAGALLLYFRRRGWI